MPELHEGDLAPDFRLPDAGGDVTLAEALAQGPVVVAFYQEDDTPTCRAQLTSFRDDYDILRELGARVLAISVDSIGSHQAFAERLQPPFPLLSDEDGAVARAWGVYDEEGRRARRAVFVVGQDGLIRLSIPWYNPANAGQDEQVCRVLGLL